MNEQEEEEHLEEQSQEEVTTGSQIEFHFSPQALSLQLPQQQDAEPRNPILTSHYNLPYFNPHQSPPYLPSISTTGIERNFLFDPLNNYSPYSQGNLSNYNSPLIVPPLQPIPPFIPPSLPIRMNRQRSNSSSTSSNLSAFSPPMSTTRSMSFSQSPPQTGPIRRKSIVGSSDESRPSTGRNQSRVASESEIDAKEDKRKRNAESSARHREKTRSRMSQLENQVARLEVELEEALADNHAIIERDRLIASLRNENYELRMRQQYFTQSAASTSKESLSESPYPPSTHHNSPQQSHASLPLPYTQVESFVFPPNSQNQLRHHQQRQNHLNSLQLQQQQQFPQQPQQQHLTHRQLPHLLVPTTPTQTQFQQHRASTSSDTNSNYSPSTSMNERRGSEGAVGQVESPLSPMSARSESSGGGRRGVRERFEGER